MIRGVNLRSLTTLGACAAALLAGCGGSTEGASTQATTDAPAKPVVVAALGVAVLPATGRSDGVKVQSLVGSRRSVFRRGDLIVAINGRRVTSVGQTISVAHSVRFETGLTVSVVRDSHRLDLRAQLSPNAYLGAGVRMRRGVVTVARVAAGSPAADSHLHAGDVVLAINQEHVSDVSGLLAILANHAPGERVRLEISRDGRQLVLPVVLGERPSQG